MTAPNVAVRAVRRTIAKRHSKLVSAVGNVLEMTSQICATRPRNNRQQVCTKKAQHLLIEAQGVSLIQHHFAIFPLLMLSRRFWARLRKRAPHQNIKDQNDAPKRSRCKFKCNRVQSILPIVNYTNTPPPCRAIPLSPTSICVVANYLSSPPCKAPQHSIGSAQIRDMRSKL